MKSPTHRVAAWLRRLLYEDRGQDMIEYALLAAAVAVAGGAVLPPMAGHVSVIFSRITSSFARVPSDVPHHD
jgi:Flp pilus assembly pilin Flp